MLQLHGWNAMVTKQGCEAAASSHWFVSSLARGIMKQAYFAALDRQQADSVVPRGTGTFQASSQVLPLVLKGEFRPCAASSGVTHEQLAAIVHLAGFEPPSHLNGIPPVSLSLLQTPAAGRFLSHGSVAPATNGTPTHSFTHVLLDIPATLDPHQAIQTWGSQQWQRSAADGLGQLSDALIPPVSVELSDKRLTEFVSDDKNRQLFHFLLAAFLTTPEDSKIFLAAPSEAVALCIYGLTRALPANTQEALTFTTYAHRPLDVPARIIGTVPSSDDQELPPSCHDGAGVAINYFTGTMTSIDMDVPCVVFAVQLIASGNFAPLDDFRVTWQRLGLKDVRQIDLVYRLGQGPDAISKEEAITALQDPSLASWVAPRAEYQQLFLNWAMDDVDFATTTFPRVVTALRQKPEALAKIASTLHDSGIKAVKDGDITKTRCALEVLLPMVSPASGQAIWGELLQTLSSPRDLPWEMQSYLLPKITRLRPLSVGQTPDSDIRRWLRIPTDKINELLGMSLSQGYQVATTLELLHSDKEHLETIASALASNSPLALTIIQQLLNSSDGKSIAHELYALLVQKTPHASWLNDVIKLDPPVSPTFLNYALGVALDLGKQAIDSVNCIRQHGPALIERLGGQGNLDRLAAQTLDGQAGELLRDEPVKNFFIALEGKAGISGPVQERLAALLKVHRYFEQPSVRPDQLNAMAKALLLEPRLFGPATYHQLLRSALSSMGTSTFQDELVGILLNWGPLFNGPSPLYRDCLKYCQENKHFWKTPEQIQAFLAVALDGTPSEVLNSQTEGLEAEAYSLVENMVRRGGKKAWEEMNVRIAEWPRPAKRQWQFLSQAIMPSHGRGVSRDFLFALIGAAITAAIFAGLRWMGYL